MHSPPKVRLRREAATESVGSLGKSAMETSLSSSGFGQSPQKKKVMNGTRAREQRWPRRPPPMTERDGGGGGGGGAASSSCRGHTPDWIRDIFLNAKRGIIEKLVRTKDNRL